MIHIKEFTLTDASVVSVFQVFPGDAFFKEYFDLRTLTWCKEVGGVYAETLSPGKKHETDGEDTKLSTSYFVAVCNGKVIGGFRLILHSDGQIEVSRFVIRPVVGKCRLADTRLIVAAFVATMQEVLPTHNSVIATINSVFLVLIKRLRIGVEFERTGPDVTYKGSEGQDITFTPVRMSLATTDMKTIAA